LEFIVTVTLPFKDNFFDELAAVWKRISLSVIFFSSSNFIRERLLFPIVRSILRFFDSLGYE
jgi:hypothetical protein